MKTFVEKYDTVTTPSGEGQAVRKQMTVQVEQWWNSSDVVVSLREERSIPSLSFHVFREPLGKLEHKNRVDQGHLELGSKTTGAGGWRGRG